MRIAILAGLCALLLTACYSPIGGGPGHVRLNSLNGDGRPVYVYPREPGAPTEDRCFTVVGFPQTPAHLGVAVTNPAGIGRIDIAVLRGKVVEGSIVAAPDWTVAVRPGGTTHTDITFAAPSAGRVVSDALAVFDVTSTGGAVSIDVLVYDTAGTLATALTAVRIWPKGDPLACS